LSLTVLCCQHFAGHFIPASRLAPQISGLNYSYTTADKTLTISGAGAMPDFTNDQPWKNHQGEIETIAIGDGVSSVGGNAFADCRKLTSVTLPASVTAIGGGAFLDCKALTDITVSWDASHIPNINPSAFGDLTPRLVNDVSQLKEVTVSALLPMLANIFVLAGMFAVMLALNWRLALLSLIPLPVMWYSAKHSSRLIHEASRRTRSREGALAATASESMAAIRTVQSLTLENKFRHLFEGSDKIKRDFVYIKDVVQANLLALNAASGVYNAATGTARSFQEIVDILQRELGSNLPCEYIPNPYARSYQFHTQADIEPTKKALGYEPKFSLEEGIKDYAAEIKRIYEEEINA